MNPKNVNNLCSSKVLAPAFRFAVRLQVADYIFTQIAYNKNYPNFLCGRLTFAMPWAGCRFQNGSVTFCHFHVLLSFPRNLSACGGAGIQFLNLDSRSPAKNMQGQASPE
jgi:hypothetical protein